ncbi:MAG: hypothetical protein ACOX7X_02965 [Methanosarcina flavescens]|jgi:hypothetical protein|uniref:PepSY domain-containing protein n=1 Tax=Methanosarcina flavescens TaxID=1715806 RepID=A0A660HP16_9EURY|nr:PepSY domain-containing protein [Methanosarcina flavescens]AYK14003.1 hypothetical protein AOB57_001190 [Methanosarcina flavescens]NLK32763.1 PepSY domain-containing protein [Methanosarcina flavescens]
MRKAIIAILLGILLVGASGAAVVSAVTSDNAGTNYGFGSHRWAARCTGLGPCAGNFSGCPYFNSDNPAEVEVETSDEALEIARKEIDSKVSKDDISQMRRWWIVSYQDEDGVYKQARIDAVSGEVFTDYPVCAGAQAGERHCRGQGHSRGYSY